MSYIAPNSTIVFCKNVPFDRGHTHTVRFNSKSEQYTAIYNCRKNSPDMSYVLSAQSYQRYDKNSLRVQIVADNLYDCNYLMFQNTSFGNKWFYAFIDGVEYINNVTSEVRYTIDVMQTYIFPTDYRLKECFIEREHIYGDAIGKSLTPENIDLGEMIVHGDGKHNFLKTRMYTVIMYVPNYDKDANACSWIILSGGLPIVTTTPPSEQYTAGIRNQFGGGIATLVIPHDTFPLDYTKVVQICVAGINAISGTIVGCFDIMGEMYDDNFTTQSLVKHTFSTSEAQNFVYANDPIPNNPQHKYIPKNKKLFQSPFRKLIFTNGNGTNLELNWELFYEKNSSGFPIANFEYIHALLPDPTTVAYPMKYRGNFLNEVDFENKCVIKDYPRQCYTEDSYSQWAAQNATALSLSTLGSIVGTFVGVSNQRNAKARTAGSAIGNVMDAFAQAQKARDTPDSTTIQDNSPIINLLCDRFGYCWYDIGVSGEMAEIIDNYFSMYGYAVNAVKTPNIVGNQRRAGWNYIKMSECVIDSNELPASAEEEISNIYKNGITFWEHITQVGDYTLNNPDI